MQYIKAFIAVEGTCGDPKFFEVADNIVLYPLHAWAGFGERIRQKRKREIL
jgi:hypothetical protein